MRRVTLAVACLIGASVPIVVATLLLVGCCVLPFHRVVHKVMPVCHVAMSVLRGDHQDEHQAPAREKQEPAKRLATELTSSFRLAGPSREHHDTPSAATGFRSFITLGAVRCDQDVGLHVFVETFLI